LNAKTQLLALPAILEIKLKMVLPAQIALKEHLDGLEDALIVLDTLHVHKTAGF